MISTKTIKNKKDLTNFFSLMALLFVVVTTLLNFNQGVEFLDEGVLNMGAWRISQGEVPYRDFFIPSTPFSFYLLGFLYKIFGVSVLTGRVAAIFLSAALIFSIYLLSNKIISKPLFSSIPIIIMTQAGMSMWHFMSHHWLGNLFTVLSLYFLILFLENQKSRFIFLSGFFAGFCFITISDQGIYNIVFFLAALLIFKKDKFNFNTFFSFLKGVSIAVIPLIVYLLIKVPFSTLFYDLFIFPFTGYKSIESNRMGIFYPFQELIYVWKNGIYKYDPFWTILATISSLLIALIPYLTLISYIFLLKFSKNNKKALTLTFLGSLIMLLTAARRWAPINLYWASSIPSILFALTLSSIYKKEKKTLKVFSLSICWFFILIFFLFGTVRTVKLFDKSKNIKIESRVGVLYLDKPFLASQFTGLLEAIEKTIPPNEPFFSREIAIINFLTLRKNPSKIDFFKPPYYTPSFQIEDVIYDLEKKNIRFIVSLNKEFDEKNPFDLYLKEKYFALWQNNNFILYKRKS